MKDRVVEITVRTPSNGLGCATDCTYYRVSGSPVDICPFRHDRNECRKHEVNDRVIDVRCADEGEEWLASASYLNLHVQHWGPDMSKAVVGVLRKMADVIEEDDK